MRCSRPLLVVVSAVALLSACSKKDEGGAAPATASGDAQALLNQVKGALAQREKKLQSYHLEGTVTESATRARFGFDYRAPNRMKGTVQVDGQDERTYSFDGDRLFLLAPAEKALIAGELPKDPRESAVLLTQLFGQFAPEGYRAPLLELDKAGAKKVTHPKAADAVEVTSTSKDEAGAPITVTYVYRMPAMDLLEKRLNANGNAMTLTVDEEQCEDRLKLCVPKKLTQRFGAETGAVTELAKIDFNAQVPNDAFTIALPEGFTLKKQGE